jgi:hypothetical protein
VRYIDWFITTPLLLTDLLLTAGMPWPSVLYIILVDWIMIVTGLAGALVRTSYKWGYFTFGCVALFYILYVLAWEARKHANAMGKEVGKTFMICGSLTAVLWTLYPIAWGVCEGGNYISPDSEAAFYGVLDVWPSLSSVACSFGATATSTLPALVFTSTTTTRRTSSSRAGRRSSPTVRLLPQLAPLLPPTATRLFKQLARKTCRLVCHQTEPAIIGNCSASCTMVWAGVSFGVPSGSQRYHITNVRDASCYLTDDVFMLCQLVIS